MDAGTSRRVLAAAGLLIALATRGEAQEPAAEYSLGLVYGHDCCAVSAQATEPLNNHLALVGGVHFGADRGGPAVATYGFYGGPRLYGGHRGRIRPFWETTFGFWQSALPDTHGFILTPAAGFEIDLLPGARVRSSAGFGIGRGGFNVTTAFVLVGGPR